MLAQVIHPKPALERWLVSAVRHFRRTAKNEVVEESLSLLLNLLESLHSSTPLDLELATSEELDVRPPSFREEERQRSESFYDRFSTPAEEVLGSWGEYGGFSKEQLEYGKEHIEYTKKPGDCANGSAERTQWSYGSAGQPESLRGQFSNGPPEMSAIPRISPVVTEEENWGRERDFSNAPPPVEFSKHSDDPAPTWEGNVVQPLTAWEPPPGGWGQDHPAYRDYEPGPSKGFGSYKPPAESDSWGARERDFGNNGDHSRGEPTLLSAFDSVEHALLTTWPPPTWRAGGRPSQEPQELEKPSADAESWRGHEFANGGLRKELGAGGPALIPSPKQPSNSLSKASSPNEAGWYSDGNPAAMDVFAASPHLWVGSLGSTENEALIKFHFEKFGPIECASRGRDFATLEYRSVRDAVKAREIMQGSMLWGKPLQIKFLDNSGQDTWSTNDAVSPGCHVWVGGISSQSAKEELLKDVVGAGLKGPRSVFALVSASAILLEFEAPEEAAAIIVHVRQRRKDGGGPLLPPTKAISDRNMQMLTSMTPSSDGLSPGGNRHLWIGRVDPLIHDEKLLAAFSQYGELTGWKFLRQSGCCFIDFRCGTRFL